ncbi:hypothetical protein AKJ65_04195 [candidate division MSBL1 archaeon SCGC-AAA259E19]|uniref:Uncharacterized protein n=2 Tax=candidate division MSBL1 TaxID=215777 RepID=A0A133V071_9EURY|nr:hypothetical protein AKJ65_04195 [candidate division MSBL1 archaeon SCGC-AAA259E19]KXA99824.1 hypothetical protein AKJ41_04805 [candidate division MSBL1 archaeon SCGC-AAA259O05]
MSRRSILRPALTFPQAKSKAGKKSGRGVRKNVFEPAPRVNQARKIAHNFAIDVMNTEGNIPRRGQDCDKCNPKNHQANRPLHDQADKQTYDKREDQRDEP